MRCACGVHAVCMRCVCGRVVGETGEGGLDLDHRAIRGAHRKLAGPASVPRLRVGGRVTRVLAAVQLFVGGRVTRALAAHACACGACAWRGGRNLSARRVEHGGRGLMIKALWRRAR